MRESSVRSAISTSVSSRKPGTTAPSRMALRTEASASSGFTRIAGGGLRPMRCSAPSTSASTSRRPASDCLMPSSCVFSASTRSVMSSMSWLSFRSVLADWISAAVIDALVLLDLGDLGGERCLALLRQADLARDALIFGDRLAELLPFGAGSIDAVSSAPAAKDAASKHATAAMPRRHVPPSPVAAAAIVPFLAHGSHDSIDGFVNEPSTITAAVRTSALSSETDGHRSGQAR